MDIKELQDYRLADAVKFHTHLNPKIWGSDEHLLPEVREKLLAIAKDFKEFLGIGDLEVKDITISGSNAAYTYTNHSDIDLHLVADLPKADQSEVYRELFDAKKYQYNDQHDYRIGGIPVELYVQNANETPESQGIYSVSDNKWISVPRRRKPTIDDISVKSKYEDIGKRIESAIESGDIKKLNAIAHKLKSFRQAGLDKTGEFGPENLAFKVLRSNGTLDQLRAARSAAKSRALSIDEEKNKKKKVKYGYNDMWFPGYHYYGDSAKVDDDTVTPDDVGADEVDESAGDIQATLNKFAAYCIERLGIENPPRLQLKRDPAWSERNSTFGQYNPATSVMTLSIANRHLVDIMRTLAHELVHRRQDEIERLPADSGATGSRWENQANAEAGKIMRDYGAENPELFDRKPLGEASGYIPVNKKEARDPRYSMAITVDIKPGELKRQAAKMGWTTDAAGTPPTARTNGLVEALKLKLQNLKENKDIDEHITNQIAWEENEQLDEVAMSPGALQTWAQAHAAGMKSGFEAELVFADALEGVRNGGSDDTEPDYEQDERTLNIDNILEFFSSEMSRDETRRLRDHLYEGYHDWQFEAIREQWSQQDKRRVREWIEENDWDWQEKIAAYLKDELELSDEQMEEVMDDKIGSEYQQALKEVEYEFDQRVDTAMEEQNDDWQSAYDEFSEEYVDDLDEDEWLYSQDLRYMSDVENVYSVSWPHWRPVDSGVEYGEFHEDTAEQLADSLHQTLGVKTTVSSGYHGAARDTESWIFEPDGSLEGNSNDDMPVEIVSPPMPLEKTLEIMPRFFEWAEAQGAYANKSTGFHMSVSMPEHRGKDLDFTKTVLFLGDQYVLDSFGRAANTYCHSALKKIKEKIDARRVSLTKSDNLVEKALERMRKGLDRLAAEAFAYSSGYGKYYTINPKEKYIEFRSAGGKDYIKDVPKLQNTMLRYARALSLGMDPAAEKQEYAKKLYKLLGNVETQQVTDPKTGSKRTEVKPGNTDQDVISFFSRYVAGDLPKTALKSFIRQLQSKRSAKKQQIAAPRTGESTPAVYTNPPGMTASDPNGNFAIRARNPDRAEGYGYGPILYQFHADSVPDAGMIGNAYAANVGEPRTNFWLSTIDDVPEQFRQQSTTDGTATMDTPWIVWNINNPSDTRQATGTTHQDAINDALLNPENSQWADGHTPAEFRARRVPESDNPPAAGTTGRPGMIQTGLVPPGMPPSTTDGNWSLRNRNNSLDFGSADGIGPILYQFQADGNVQAIDIARQYARSLEIPRERLWLSRTNEVPAEYRTQRAHLGDRIPPARTAIGGPNSDTGYWVVFSGTSYNNVAIIAATTPQQGQAAYQQWVNSDWRPEDTYHIRPATPEDLILAARNNITVPPRNAALSTDSQIQDIEPNVAQNFQQPARPTGNTFTGQWSVISSNTGEEVYRFGDIGNAQSDANRVAAVWAHRTGFDDPIEVYPVMQ